MREMHPPYHTLRPDAWCVYADWCADTGHTDHQVERVRRVARALALRPQPRLVLARFNRGLFGGWYVIKPGQCSRGSLQMEERLAWRPAAWYADNLERYHFARPSAHVREAMATPFSFAGMRQYRPDLVRLWFLRLGALYGRVSTVAAGAVS